MFYKNNKHGGESLLVYFRVLMKVPPFAHPPELRCKKKKIYNWPTNKLP